MYDPHLGGTLCTELNGHISCNLFVYIYDDKRVVYRSDGTFEVLIMA